MDGDSNTNACLEFDSVINGDIYQFNTNENVHMLPYGYYKLVVTMCSCECMRLPVIIEKCSGELAGVCVSNTKGCLPPRECKDDCYTEEKEHQDHCGKEKGNLIGKSTGLDINWEITKRAR